jgi:hypothetical protein
MLALRLLGLVGALSLMIGELWRSWGAGRHILFVLDDQFAGLLMLAGVWAMRRDTLRNRALFAAGWGVAVGMLYGSFFGKLIDPAHVQAGNWNAGVLTALLGFAFAIAIAGLVASIILPADSWTRNDKGE